MDCCFSPNEPRIKNIDETPQGQNVAYLRPERTITYPIDTTYNIPLMEIQFDGSFESSVRLWPKEIGQGQIFCCWKEHHHHR